MKIAIFSDTHIGFGKNTARSNEAFDQAKEAFELALEKKADLILLAGDLFNEAIPSQEAWVQMFKLFSLLRAKKGELQKIEYKKGEETREFLTDCTPVISIAGTHEFRGKDFKNALEVLQEAGCLVFIHAAKAVFEKDSEKIVVQGLSGIPEKKALDALKMWNPKPEQGACNLVLLHQSIKEFLPFDDDMVASISLADLPQGFDLVIDGHLHWASEEHLTEKNFLVTGSTIITQMKKLEAKKPKGIFIFESKDKSLQFITLPKQRKFIFEKLEFKEGTTEQIKEAVEKKLDQILSNSQNKPLIKIKLKGSLVKGLENKDIDLRAIQEKFRDKALLFIDCNFEEEGFKQKLEQLRKTQLGNKSVAAMGFDLLEKNLAETGFNNAFEVKRVFDLLAEGDINKVVGLLSEKRGK